MQIHEMAVVDYGWMKFFEDGTSETGRDQDIKEGKSSWTRGRQNGILGVSLSDGHTSIYLVTEDNCPGKFWQSDDYEVVFGQVNPRLVRRRIQLKVGDKAWKTIEIDNLSHEVKEYVSKHKI